MNSPFPTECFRKWASACAVEWDRCHEPVHPTLVPGDVWDLWRITLCCCPSARAGLGNRSFELLLRPGSWRFS